ncbi:solute carrier, TRAMD3 or PAT1-domain-containing protein [Phlyctochytrium arcticum]|nr:solute carrier, TRAMD3 or PAT1-domain-containing protein [Phlyctochytrium arcticum]
MASQTIVQTRIMPNRAHDYLYDVNHTVAGRNDHVRNLVKSQTHDVVIHPSYQNMFSALPHHPAAGYTLRTHHMPPDLGQDRRTFISANPDVTGMNRFKYFKRPIVPYMPSLGTQIVYARRNQLIPSSQIERPASPLTKTIGIQTMYRESEAQTDPFSPDYVTVDGTTPELLALATLTHEAGLPVTQTELEMIERARAKRAWEKSLPVVVDQESFEKRLRMMEEMELAEWRDREEEIKRIQEARLEVLKQVIEHREADNERLNNERVHRVWERKLMERDEAVERIQRKRVKALRKLTQKRAHVEPMIYRRDIINDYADYGSVVYAPKTRDGVFWDKPEDVVVRVQIDDFNGIQELEASLPPRYLVPDFALPSQSRLQQRSLPARRDQHIQNQLELMDQKLKQKPSEEPRPLRFAQRIEKPPVRPPTPHIQDPSPEDEELDIAAIFLQRIIRGRVVQNAMYQGKERRLNLINELRTRQTVQAAVTAVVIETPTGKSIASRPVSAATAKATFSSLLALPDVPVPQIATAAGDAAASQALENGLSMPEAVQEAIEREKAMIAERSVGSTVGGPGDILTDKVDEEIIFTPVVSDAEREPLRPTLQNNLDELQATYTTTTLHYLTAELTRLREARRISAMVRLALRTRRMREAEESGRRQAEIHRRMIEDEVFRQVMQVHQSTVDSFLENVVCGSVDRSASIESRRAVRDYASRMSDVIGSMEQDQEGGDPRIVRDLVNSFLIPEVERQTLKSRLKNEQRKYLQAAHESVYNTLPAVERASNRQLRREATPQNRPQSSPLPPLDAPVRAENSSVSELPQADGQTNEEEQAKPLSERRESRPASRAAGPEF